MFERYQSTVGVRKKLAKLTGSIGSLNDNEVEEQINRIGLRLATETLTLKEEKSYLSQIAALKEHRPLLSKFKEVKDVSVTKNGDGNTRRQIALLEEEMVHYLVQNGTRRPIMHAGRVARWPAGFDSSMD